MRKGIVRKRKAIVILLSFCMMMQMSACFKDEHLQPFVGKWKCQNMKMEGGGSYCGGIVLEITEDGRYTMIDMMADNPGMAGKIRVESPDEIVLESDTASEFYPPTEWGNMTPVQELDYKFVNETQMRLTLRYRKENTTLIFDKVE